MRTSSGSGDLVLGLERSSFPNVACNSLTDLAGGNCGFEVISSQCNVNHQSVVRLAVVVGRCKPRCQWYF